MTERNPKGPRYYDPLTRRRLSRSQTSLYLAASTAPRIRVTWSTADEGAVMIEGAARTWRRQTFNRLKHLFVLLDRIQPIKSGPIVASDFALRADLRAQP